MNSPDAPMEQSNQPNQPNTTESEFEAYRKACLRRLRRDQKHIPHSIWRPGDGAGREPDSKTRANSIFNSLRWRTITLKWDPIAKNEWPPKNVFLSDWWVYLAVKLLSRQERASRYSGDFDKEGDIRLSRIPRGDPPVILAHGLYCLPVYKEFYVLCGENLAEYGNWSIGDPERRRYDEAFKLGQVCVPAEVIQAAGLTVERRLSLHDAPNLCDSDRPATRDWRAAEAEVGAHDLWVRPYDDMTTMLYGLHPHEEPNYRFLPITEVPGFTYLCDANDQYSSQLQKRPFVPASSWPSSMSGVQSGTATAGSVNWDFVNENDNFPAPKKKPRSPSMPGAREDEPPTVDGICNGLLDFIANTPDMSLWDIETCARDVHEYLKWWREKKEQKEGNQNG